jgi:hypothetical protein
MKLLSYREAQTAFAAGDRIESFEAVEAFPHYMVRSGARFTVRENGLGNDGALILHLDDLGDLLAGDLTEWDNCLEFWGPDQDGILSEDGVADNDVENPGHAGNLPIFPFRKIADQD